MLVIVRFSLYTQSSVRAYVTGESEWSKGQKDAVFYLNRYVESKSAFDYDLYTYAIAVPLGDHLARISLNQSPPDTEAAKTGFLQGKNHPEDIGGLIKLYVHLHDTLLMREPVELWKKGDVIILKIQKLAEALKQTVDSTPQNTKAIKLLIDEINRLNIELTPIEEDFSNALGEISRQINTWFYVMSLIFTAILVAIGVTLSRRMVQFNLMATEKIKNSELRFKALLGSSMDAVIEINAESEISHWSAQAEQIFGYLEYEAIGEKLHLLIIPAEHIEAHLMGMRRFLKTGDGPVLNKRIEVTAKRKSKEEFPAELVVSAYALNGKHMFCAYIRDITEQKKYAEKLRTIAHFDSVTGLPNRLLFQDCLDGQIKLCDQSNLPLSVMFIDIDNFKDINDTLGHQTGDYLLKEVSKRMLGCLRKADFLARFGGDEFVLIVNQFNADDDVDDVAERLIEALKVPFQIQNEMVYVTISIGISSYPTDSHSYHELVKNADQAMYMVKKSGRNGYAHFNTAMEESVVLKRQLTSDIRLALQDNQFEIYYQPIVDLQTNQILKCEALLRWNHPSKGMIQPGVFIGIAEDTGLIVEIGDMVFQRALAAVLGWRKTVHPDFQVSINVSPVQLHQAGGNNWCYKLKNALSLTDALVIEITEGVLVNANEVVSKALLEYRDAGIQVALDDFGTGYSSLSYLTKFDIDYIKIDKSFLVDLSEASENYALCEAMIVMAHKLGLAVVAEGVETPEQLALLKQIGCDYAQGYLFARPIPELDLEPFLIQFNTRKLEVVNT
jgi:diguanylate cyclase (GGDEF)-like protein/PAS domain S-box-containing protein